MTRASITRSLQYALAQPYQNTVVVTASSLASQDIDAITHQLDDAARRSITSATLPHAGLALRSQDVAWGMHGLVHVKSFPDDYVSHNFTLITGRFPDARSSANEIVVSQQTANQLHLAIHMTIPLRLADASSPLASPIGIPLSLVGIVEPHGADLYDPYSTEPVDPVASNTVLTAVVVE